MRADKVLKLRSLLDKLSPVKGLTNEEKGMCPLEFVINIITSNRVTLLINIVIDLVSPALIC